MRRVSRSLSVLVVPGCASASAVVMAVVGLWAIADCPRRFPAYDREFFWIGGAILVAAGQFIFAVTTAGRLFPLADPRLKLSLEALPLAALVVALIGGILWIA